MDIVCVKDYYRMIRVDLKTCEIFTKIMWVGFSLLKIIRLMNLMF